MDFFANQERAQRLTRLMLALFAIAVVCIVLAVDVAAGFAYVSYRSTQGHAQDISLSGVPHQVYWVTSALVISLIALGSLERTRALAEGGGATAEMMGGRRIAPDSADAAERRLLNIVQEMAIAAGIALPQVYVMDGQPAINAFVTGHSPNDAAISVTQGALKHLERDELQGVVAHEFSHILNGDMRLNMRLVGLLAGIVVLGSLGDFLMEVSYDGGGRLRRVKDLGWLYILGAAACLVGALGVFWGRLIKAAVSRQREFLADASAVQFTRNPEGIANALRCIDDHGSGMVLRYEEEFSHMYFSAGLKGFFATHPPLHARVRRILGSNRHLVRGSIDDHANGQGGANTPRTVAPPEPPAEMMTGVGQLTGGQMDFARNLLTALPPQMLHAIATAQGAKVALFALVLGEGLARVPQFNCIRTAAGNTVAQAVARQADWLAPYGPGARLPVLDLATATLRRQPQNDNAATLNVLYQTILADGKVTLGEFVLLALCRQRLLPGKQLVERLSLRQAAPSATLVLSLLRRGGANPRLADADTLAMAAVQTDDALPQSATTFEAIDKALGQLRQLAPRPKAFFIKACFQALNADAPTSAAEGHLLRAICASLDVPMPPQGAWAPV